MRHVVWFPVLALAIGCSIGGKKSEQEKAAASGGAATPAAAAAGASDLAKVSLDPLPLEIQVKAGGMGAMDMSLDDKKSVTVDIGDGASLNISPEERKLAQVKKSYAGDTVLFPFKKWEKEEGNTAVLQFASDGKKGYIGFTLVEVGGKPYLCKTTGLDGVASVELAEKHLAACKTLSAK
ncbi:MAG: hypothetical protein HS104_18340 [Polyangiaceae bacterium]|nr:hypothetical protein [Polyangiaceae bacterium]MBK9001548.1 hypothetical protein [Myxococcales bacterium]MCL4753933.1 hypothetical protein [Myxococcales bacterium]